MLFFTYFPINTERKKWWGTNASSCLPILNLTKKAQVQNYLSFFSLSGKCPNLNLTCFAHILCLSIQSKQNNTRKKQNTIKMLEFLTSFNFFHFKTLKTICLFPLFSFSFYNINPILLLPRDNRNLITV